MTASSASKRPGPVARTRAGKEGKYNHTTDWKEHIVPHTIYFYYATPAKEGERYPVKAYMMALDKPVFPGNQPGQLDGYIAELTANARGGDKVLRPIGHSIDAVPWFRISYFVVALDDPKDAFDEKDAITFIRKDGLKKHPNHSFFDGWAGKVPVPGENDIAVAWAVNYMTTRSGKPIPDGKLHKFSIVFKTGKVGLLPLEFEDNGTNVGPPVPPP
jgi:hypothetical protein